MKLFLLAVLLSPLGPRPVPAAPPIEPQQEERPGQITVPVAAADFHGLGLTVELVSEVTAIQPGQPFYAGLFIRHDPAYHTYWKNPGLAGVPTKLEWTLPPGWKAGEIEWPAPDKVMMANIATHGYERDVLLMVKLTPPAEIREAAVTLQTKASWMCCARTCNPGFCDLALKLPVAAGAKPSWHPQWHKVFEKERAAFPVPLTGWKLSAVKKGKKIILTGEPAKPGTAMPGMPVFFSADNFICSHPPQKWRVTPNGFHAELEMSDLPPKDQSVLRGLLRSKSGWVPRPPRAAIIEVPVK